MTTRTCDQPSTANPEQLCPYTVVVGTDRCLEHAEPHTRAPIPALRPLGRSALHKTSPRPAPAVARPYGHPSTPSELPVAPTLGVGPRERVVIHPPAPAETLELADQLAEHGGHDETFVADALRDAIAAAENPASTDLIVISNSGGPNSPTLELIEARRPGIPDEWVAPPCTDCGRGAPCTLACLEPGAAQQLHRQVVIAEVLRPAPTDTDWLAVEPAARGHLRPAPPSRRGWIRTLLRRRPR